MNFMKMMKQAGSMRKEIKQIQKGLEKEKVEYSSGNITVVARGDMSIESITIDPASVDAAQVKRLEERLVKSINGALSDVKDKAAAEMSKLTAGMGMGNLLGG